MMLIKQWNKALRNHTHCQVSQKSHRSDQNLSKSIAAQTHGQTVENKARKHNKVSYVMRGKVLNLNISTINIRCSNLIVRSFHIRTTHTLGRCAQC
jgi:hypothetical protein